MSGVTKLLLTVLALALLMSFNGRLHFMVDNLSSFRVHFALAFTFCVVVFAVYAQWRWTALAAVCLAATIASIVPWYTGGEDAGTDRRTAVSFVVSNVSPRNKEPERLAAMLREQKPDVVGLVELTPTYLTGIASVVHEYPYIYESPKAGFWGLGLYSRLPLLNARLVELGEDVPPAIAATMRTATTETELVLLHPFPPMNANLAAKRNLQLRKLAEYVSNLRAPTVILGDLNTALWSPYYKELVSKGKLRNARQGHGVNSTWPAVSGLGVPIDHVLYTDSIDAKDFTVLGNIGSDHFPIAADLLIPRLPAATVGSDGTPGVAAGPSR